MRGVLRQVLKVSIILSERMELAGPKENISVLASNMLPTGPLQHGAEQSGDGP